MQMAIRIDNVDPGKEYKDFWDWLVYDWHLVFVLAVAVGYVYYLMTTTEA